MEVYLASSLPNPTNKNADNVKRTKVSNFSSPSVPVVRPVSTKRIETSLHKLTNHLLTYLAIDSIKDRFRLTKAP